jgi:cyclase
MYVRVIPRLDIKGPNLVKGIHLEGLRVLGRPEEFAEAYYDAGADELLYMDVVASLYGRNSLTDVIERTSRRVFIPLTVGGGIRTADDIRGVLRAGADKVALNTAALARPEFVREAARRFGSSTIVVSIEAIRHSDGRYEAYTDNGREKTGIDACEWAVRAAELGAGELLVTSIDREGTGTGYDLELTRRVATAVPIPVIACGGAGRIEHLSSALHEGHADALCLASMLHYQHVRGAVAPGVEEREGNTEYLRSGRGFAGRSGVGFETATVAAIKRALTGAGIATREGTTSAQVVQARSVGAGL